MSDTQSPTQAPDQKTETPAPWWAKYYLATVIVLVFAGCLYAVSGTADHDLKLALYMIAGSAFATSVGFFFGGALSGAGKDATIAAIATQASQPATQGPKP